MTIPAGRFEVLDPMGAAERARELVVNLERARAAAMGAAPAVPRQHDPRMDREDNFRQTPLLRNPSRGGQAVRRNLDHQPWLRKRMIIRA
jgi:hypothetical protein